MDDILLIENDIPMLQSVKTWLSSKFSMKHLGEASYILGIKIYKDRSKRMLGVGAKIRLHRRSWSRESRGRHRDLQKKSKPKVGLLRQDPPMLKLVLCLNKNGVLE